MQSNLSNLKHMQSLRQWVLWRKEDKNGKQTKVPVSPHDGTFASVTNPSTWGSYEQCAKIVADNRDYGIGFVLTANDPYVCIDIDKDYNMDTLKKMWDSIKTTYVEKSPSGYGYHVWGTMASANGAGLRQGNIEVYQKERFITWTDAAITSADVADITQIVDAITKEIKEERAKKQPVHTTVAQEITAETKDIVAKIKQSAVCGTVTKLYRGEWEDLGFPSQSEADLAFCSYLSFFGATAEQVEEVWRSSKLWRPKCDNHPYYKKNTINRSKTVIAKELPDLSGLLGSLNNKVSSALESVEDTPKNDVPAVSESELSARAKTMFSEKWSKAVKSKETVLHTVPSKIFNKIASDLAKFQPRAIEASPMFAMLAWMAGECGNLFKTSGMGLNAYMVLVSDSGSGKEGLTTMLDKIGEEYAKAGLDTGFRTYGTFSSHQAIRRVLGERNCTMSVVNEFGLFLRQITSTKASSSQASVKDLLLELFSKSAGGTLDGQAYSSKERTLEAIKNPSYSIMGETTGASLYDSFTPEAIRSGLIPRMFVWDSPKKRSYLSRDFFDHKLSQESVDKIVSVGSAIINRDRTKPATIRETEGVAELSQLFDVFVTDYINNCEDETDVLSIVLSRVEAKARKLAGLVAVFENPVAPVMTKELYEWGLNMALEEGAAITRRLASGLVGAKVNGTASQSIEQSVKHLFQKGLAAGTPSVCSGVLRVRDIWQHCRKKVYWTQSKDATSEFARVLDGMVRAGIYERMDKFQAKAAGLSGDCLIFGKEDVKEILQSDYG